MSNTKSEESPIRKYFQGIFRRKKRADPRVTPRNCLRCGLGVTIPPFRRVMGRIEPSFGRIERLQDQAVIGVDDDTESAKRCAKLAFEGTRLGNREQCLGEPCIPGSRTAAVVISSRPKVRPAIGVLMAVAEALPYVTSHRGPGSSRPLRRGTMMMAAAKASVGGGGR